MFNTDPTGTFLAIVLVLNIIRTAVAADYPLAADATAVGSNDTYVARADDTLADIARHYDLGYTQIVAANPGIDPWFPGGRRVLLATYHLLPDAPHRGIVINLGEERLYYYPPDGRSVVTFPIGIAVEMPRTPLGATRIVSKHEHPIWYPPPSIREEQPDLPLAIGPGSDNPLGSFALYLGWSGYLIHGTNKPDSVGRMASHGCIHLYPEDVALLYDRVSIGTPVTVINEPVKVQWVGDVLYAEVHPSAAQALALESGESPKREQPADLAQRVRAAAATDDGGVNWGVVERVASERTGVPRAVAVRRTGASGLAD